MIQLDRIARMAALIVACLPFAFPLRWVSRPMDRYREGYRVPARCRPSRPQADLSLLMIARRASGDGLRRRAYSHHSAASWCARESGAATVDALTSGGLPRRGISVQRVRRRCYACHGEQPPFPWSVAAPITVKTHDGEVLVRERSSRSRTYLPSQRWPDSTMSRTDSAPTPRRRSTVSANIKAVCSIIAAASSSLAKQHHVAIPLLVEQGYAIFWNTASFSYIDNRFPLELNLESMAAPRSTTTFFTARRWTHHPLIPLADRACAALSRVGLRLLPVEGPLQDAGRDSRGRRRYRAPHSSRRDRAGLVLVEARRQGRSGLQLRLHRRARRAEDAA